MELHGFYRPLQLRPPVADRVAKRLRPSNRLADVSTYRHQRGLLVPPVGINPDNQYSIPDLHLIIFPMYRSRAELTLVRLSPAHTCARLMGCLVNARNLPNHGLPEITRLSRKVMAYSLSGGDADQMVDKIETLL